MAVKIMPSLSNLQLAGIVFCLSVIYLFGLGIYRLYFHPLAKFPGPKIAALSEWYETYHNVYRRGQFTPLIRDWHGKYGKRIYHPIVEIAGLTIISGPIVRIGPNQLNVHDLDFFEEMQVSYPQQAVPALALSWFLVPSTTTQANVEPQISTGQQKAEQGAKLEMVICGTRFFLRHRGP